MLRTATGPLESVGYFIIYASADASKPVAKGKALMSTQEARTILLCDAQRWRFL